MRRASRFWKDDDPRGPDRLADCLRIGTPELRERLASALAPLGVPGGEGPGGGGDAPGGSGPGAGGDGSGYGGRRPGFVRVRTFHALGLEVLRDSGSVVEPLVDRMAILRRIAPDAGAAGPLGWRSLDTAISRLKLDIGVQAADVAADAEAGPIARAFVAYEAAIAETGGLDFDDLVARALRTLETDAVLLERWRDRCAHLLVDEAQDLDRAQLRLALLLAAPENRIFLVGDDDQSIYRFRGASFAAFAEFDARFARPPA